MLSDTVKYWLAVAAIMVAMFGYSGKVSTALIFGIAAFGAFVFWTLTARKRKRALEQRAQGRPGGA